MKITVTELKNNLDKYLDIARYEKITITKNGKNMVVLGPSSEDAYHSLKGCLKEYKNEYIDSAMNLRDLKWDRLKNE